MPIQGVPSGISLKNGPGETRDLAKDNPEKLTALVAIWDQYAKANGVILTGDGPFNRGKEASVKADLDDD